MFVTDGVEHTDLPSCLLLLQPSEDEDYKGRLEGSGPAHVRR